MDVRDSALFSVVIVVNIIASYIALVAGPSPVSGNNNDIYRIFYTHTPAAWVCYLALGVSLLASILFPLKRTAKYDILAEISAFLGLIYGIIALATGSIWANAIWGAYWNWDPRQTTTLILWIAYLGYVALRLSIGDTEKRAVTSAVYNIFAFTTIPLSYMSFILWRSLHPILYESSSGITASAPVMETLFLSLIAGTLVYFYVLRMIHNVKTIQKRVETLTHEKGGMASGS